MTEIIEWQREGVWVDSRLSEDRAQICVRAAKGNHRLANQRLIGYWRRCFFIMQRICAAAQPGIGGQPSRSICGNRERCGAQNHRQFIVVNLQERPRRQIDAQECNRHLCRERCSSVPTEKADYQ